MTEEMKSTIVEFNVYEDTDELLVEAAANHLCQYLKEQPEPHGTLVAVVNGDRLTLGDDYGTESLIWEDDGYVLYEGSRFHRNEMMEKTLADVAVKIREAAQQMKHAGFGFDEIVGKINGIAWDAAR